MPDSSASDSAPGGLKVPAGLSIGAVERETGLPKETLRVWERRYGFPTPLRDSHGERLYTEEQVAKLRLMRQLIDRGMRPGQLARASIEELSRRCHGEPSAPHGSEHGEELLQTLGAVREHELAVLRGRLSMALLRLGVQRFLTEFLQPLNVLVGEAWARGELAVSDEHLYSEQVESLLRHTIEAASPGGSPLVLLTTLPGEQHQLGLLMAQTLLTAEGAQCVSLGIQTPPWEIATAARDHEVDIVGLSFSLVTKLPAACAALTALRTRLAPQTDLWAGGQIWQRLRAQPPGIELLPALADVPLAVARWRSQHGG